MSYDCRIPKRQVETKAIDSTTVRNGMMFILLCHTSRKRKALVSAIFPSTWGRKPGKLANLHSEIQDGLEVMW
jgi:hypothetical protein